MINIEIKIWKILSVKIRISCCEKKPKGEMWSSNLCDMKVCYERKHSS